MISAGDIRAAVAGGVVTVAVELGAYEIARPAGAAPREALLVALAAMIVWIAVASGALATGGAGAWGRLLRGAVPADVSLLVLGVLHWRTAGDGGPVLLTWGAVLEIYVVLAAMGLFAVALACYPRGHAGRCAAAVVAATVLLALAGTPFWSGGLLAVSGANRADVAAAVVDASPFYGITGAMAPEAHFIWHDWGVMYSAISPFGEVPAPPIRWYTSPAGLATAAALLAVAAWASHRRPTANP